MKQSDFRVSVPHSLELYCAIYVDIQGPYTCLLQIAHYSLNQPVPDRMKSRMTAIIHSFQFVFIVAKVFASRLGNPSCSCHIER